MNRNRKPLRKVLILSGITIAIVVYALIVMSTRGPRFFISPDQPRSSLDYEQGFRDESPGPKKTLSEDPPPPLRFEEKPNDTPPTFSTFYTSKRRPDRVYTPLYRADETGTVTLPEGLTVTLEAIALLRPWTLTENEQGKLETELQWIHPATGNPVDGDFRNPWIFNHFITEQGPELFLKFREGEELPVMIKDIPEGFNAKNLREISSRSGYMGGEYYSLTLGAWNQRSLEVIVEVAYGNPEIRKLPRSIGETVRLGDEVEMKLVRETNQFSGRSSQHFNLRNGMSTVETRFFPVDPDKGQTVVSRFFRVWPPEEHSRLEIRWGENKSFKKLSGGRDIVPLNKDSAAEFDAAEIRWMPKQARLVFEVPRLPNLPVVENQFETPIPRIHITKLPNLELMIRSSTEMGFSTSVDAEAAEKHFPMNLTNTTPMGMIETFEEITGATVYFDRKKPQLTDEKPKGWWEKFQGWWKRTKPKWMR